MTAGAFSDAARAAIYTAADGRCVGCGSAQLTAQHRRARGMGGTSRASAGHPANGVALCGSGTTGCHGWAEHHPTEAALLGWRLAPGEDPLVAPYRDRVYGWRLWLEDALVAYVDDEDLDRQRERADAWATFSAALRHRMRATR